MKDLAEERRRLGIGRLDECWEGVWRFRHSTGRRQRIAAKLWRILPEAIEDAARGKASISINVTDREEGWIENHRCPDGAVILQGNPGRWIGEDGVAFLGGPDLVTEVMSRGDKTRDKLPFYASLGVREVLIVEQDTGSPTIWRGGEPFTESPGVPLRSEVAGLEFSQGPEGALLVRHPASGKTWTV